MFSPAAIISLLGTAATELEGVVTGAVQSAGAKPDVVAKVQAGIDAFKTAAANLSTEMTAAGARPGAAWLGTARLGEAGQGTGSERWPAPLPRTPQT